jgi:hypothetical protein
MKAGIGGRFGRLFPYKGCLSKKKMGYTPSEERVYP